MRAEELEVVVVGGANTDFLIRGPSLPGPGRSVEGYTFQQAPGGKGANQAVGAARLEATVALIARIGHDARGDAILSRLADERVDAKAVLRDAEAETGAVPPDHSQVRTEDPVPYQFNDPSPSSVSM